MDHSEDYKLYKEAWKNFIQCKDIEDLSDDEIKLLYSYDFIPFKEFPKPKYPDGFNLSTTGNLMTYNFALLVMDRVFESESNVIEVLSDTAQIIADVFALIDDNTQDDEDFELVVTSNASPFYDAKTDILSGYAINFQVNTPYLFNTCVVPV